MRVRYCPDSELVDFILGDRIVADWTVFDRLGVLAQLV